MRLWPKGRRGRVAAAAGLVVLATVSTFLLWPRSITPGLTQENFDRVRVGMTIREVEALLGQPSSHDDSAGFPIAALTESPLKQHPDAGRWHWRAADARPRSGTVSVFVDDGGRVEYKGSTFLVVREPPSLGRALGWLKEQWQSWLPE